MSAPKAEHTPGPWKVQILWQFGMVSVVQSPAAPVAFTGVEHRSADENEANARLIAAAPELLDLCLGMRDLIDRCGVKVGAEFDAQLSAAIAKAEGAQ